MRRLMTRKELCRALSVPENADIVYIMKGIDGLVPITMQESASLLIVTRDESTTTLNDFRKELE